MRRSRISGATLAPVAIGPLKTGVSTFVGMFKTKYHNVSATLYTPDDFQTVDAVTISSTVITGQKGTHISIHTSADAAKETL